MKKLFSMLVAISVLFLQVPAFAANPDYEVSMTQAEATSSDKIESDMLEVSLNTKFPSITQYRLKTNNEIMLGNESSLSVIKIDDVPYTPNVIYKKMNSKKAEYTLSFDEINVEMLLEIAITDKAANGLTAKNESIVSYKVTQIEEKGDFKVHTIEIPDNSMFTVKSSDYGAAFVGVVNNGSVLVSGDKYFDLTTATVDSAVQKYEYGIINTSKLAATFRSNASSYNDGNLVLKQTVKNGSGTKTSVWSNKWTYRIPDYTKTFDDIRWDYTDRVNYSGGAKYDPDSITFPTPIQIKAAGSTLESQNTQVNTEYPNVTVKYTDTATMEMPMIEIVITDDINEDNIVNWMDGAVAYRDIRYLPVGYEQVSKSAVQRLIHPHSSLGSYTFMESLDETKKVYLNTDGLDQVILHKVFNYANWGDFTHYAENLGGFENFKKFVDVATNEYKGYVGVHTNFTEVFAKSRNFRPETIQPGNGGYQGFGYWFHQVYTPDKTFEATSLERRERLAGFKESVPSLGFVYSDVYTDYGLLDRRLVDDYEASDLAYFVEWPYQSEERSVWAHWAVEKNYSPPNLMAYGSDVARFINNDIKDRWDNNKNISGDRVPSSTRLLMGADTTAWEGWMASETNLKYSEAVRKVFDNNIPSKYLQRNPILTWTRGTDNWVNHIWFENNVESFFEGDVLNDATRKRVITQDGKRVYEGTAKDGVNDSKYLIPWDIEENKQADGTYQINETEGKLYHWNELGGNSTWELPNSWNNVESVKVYKLTDQGKSDETIVNVVEGKITLSAIKNVPYVVYKGDSVPQNIEVNYGEGSFVKDPGFNAVGTIGLNWISEAGSQSVVKDQKVNSSVKEVGYELEMGVDESVVSQEIKGLIPGQEYAVSVMTEIEKNKTREAILEVQLDESNAKAYSINVSNHMEANVMSPKAGTNMLPIRVTFTAPVNGIVTIRLKAGMGAAKVKFDNVRLYATQTPTLPEYADNDKTLIYQDFEYAPTGAKPNGYVVTQNDYLPTYEGYYPFFMTGSIREPKYIIEQINAPYTQNGADHPWDKQTAVVDEVINGRNSFKVVGPEIGLFVATSPNTVKFEKGKEYRVTFKYQASPGPDFAVAVGSVQNIIDSYDILPGTSKSTIYTKTFVANSDEQWVGFARVAETDKNDPTPFVLDDVLIEEIGPGVLQPNNNEQIYDVYKAENAILIEGANGSDPMKLNNGMIEFFQDIGDRIVFNDIKAAKSGVYHLEIDYTAGYNNRTATIIVNEEELEVKLPKTSGWGRPAASVTIPVNLDEGNNTIEFIIKESNGYNEWDEGRFNLEGIKVSDKNSNLTKLNVRNKIKPDSIQTYSDIELNGLMVEASPDNGTSLISQPGNTAAISFNNTNFEYGVRGISLNVKSNDEGRIEAYQNETKIGEVLVGTDYAVKYIDFNKMISGYDHITLNFIGNDGNDQVQYNISWMQFSDMREAEDSFLLNGVQIRLDNSASGRGYINEFETGVYNPAKAKREVRMVVYSDSNRQYEMDIRYAADGDRNHALALKVNERLQENISFHTTGGWLNWGTSTVDVNLSKGINVISLGVDKDDAGNFINNGGVNLDYFVLRLSDTISKDANNYIEAEDYDNAYGVNVETTTEGMTYIKDVTSDAWISFDNVYFNGTHDMLEFYTAGQGSGEVQLLVDDSAAETFIIEGGSASNRISVNLANKIVSGAHKIVLKFQSNNHIMLDRMRFITKATDIILDESISLYVSETGYINKQVLPENATYNDVIWTVKDSTVASVDQNGKVTGLKAGQTEVIATSLDGQTNAECQVIITEPDWIDAFKFEAEDAKLSGGAQINNNHANYSGTGFVDGFYNPNYYAGAEFKYNVPEPGKYKIAIRYSLGLAESKTTGLVINGTRLSQSVELMPTGGWSSWKSKFIEVELKKGENTISVKIDAMTYGDTANFNLDYISVHNCTPVKNDTPAVELSGIAVSGIPSNMYIGAKANAKVIASYSDGKNTNVTAESDYKSSDESIIAVNAQGELQAIAAGTSIITVTFEDKSQQVEVIVSARSNPDPNTEPNPGTKPDPETKTDSETKPDPGTKPEPEVPNTEFKDLGGHWAAASVRSLIDKGLISGYGDGTFRPNRGITRAEMTAILVRALRLEVTGNDAQAFTDVAEVHWAKGYIEAAWKKGIVKGKTEREFKPNDLITRQELALMVARAFGFSSADGEESGFIDRGQIAPWARAAVEGLTAQGIVNGYPDNTFRPVDHVTRAQAATIVDRVLKIVE